MPRPARQFAEVLSRGFTDLLKRSPSTRELDAFSRYLSLLLQWNRAHHLTGYHTPAQITERLFLDSLLFLQWITPKDGRLLDLGAGAGIPGIPLKIVEPGLQVTLLEARRRRSSFLATVIRELRLEGVEVRWGRAEHLLESEPTLREAFDVVVTRAAGPLEAILRLALGFLAPGGRFIASGPPKEKMLPPIPPTISHRWESASQATGFAGRRFLIADRTD
jgi:16S rRNA (guanine527-N7)-methyltransferase